MGTRSNQKAPRERGLFVGRGMDESELREAGEDQELAAMMDRVIEFKKQRGHWKGSIMPEEDKRKIALCAILKWHMTGDALW